MKRLPFILLIVLVLAACAVPRFVIVESFTNTGCRHCPPAYEALDEAARSHESEMGLIFWHVHWPGTDPLNQANPEDVNQRRLYYAIPGVPMTYCDGRPVNHEHLAERIAERRELPAPLAIHLEVRHDGVSAMLEAGLEWVAEIPETDLQLLLVIVESDLEALGRRYDYTMRRAESRPLELCDDNAPLSWEFELDADWKLEDLTVYVYLQDVEERDVLQGARLDAGDWTLIEDCKSLVE